MLKIAVCVSGGGTNLQAIIDGIESGIIKDTQIVLVFSNNPNAFALERAKKAGIKAVCKSPKEYPSRDDFNKDFLATLKEAEPDLVVLAGCMVVIPKEIVRAFPNRIINIHRTGLLWTSCTREGSGKRSKSYWCDSSFRG